MLQSKEKNIRADNPFDRLLWDDVALSCSRCANALAHGVFFCWGPDGEQLQKIEDQNIKHEIASHVCDKQKEAARNLNVPSFYCQNYSTTKTNGCFGDQCDDCRAIVVETQAKNKRPQRANVFRVEQWVIDTITGKLHLIESQALADLMNEQREQGINHHLKPYD
jgi:hypothetical protein